MTLVPVILTLSQFNKASLATSVGVNPESFIPAAKIHTSGLKLITSWSSLSPIFTLPPVDAFKYPVPPTPLAIVSTPSLLPSL
jgi:hypothetical protein